MDQYKLDLNGLLLAYESKVIALYDLQRADASEDDFLDIDVEGSIIKNKAAIEKLRERILTFHEKWPNWDADRLELINQAKRYQDHLITSLNIKDGKIVAKSGEKE